MTGKTLPESATFADRLSPLERAKLGLQDELTVFEIGLLTYSSDGDLEQRQRLTDFLLEAIKAGHLVVAGDPDGWQATVQFSSEGEAQNKGPFPSAQRHQGTRKTLRRREQLIESHFGLVRLEKQDWHGDNCLVTWMDYRAFLATPAARGIPEPNWPACPRLENAVPYEQAKAQLHASDADMCGWTLNRGFRPNSGLTAYEKFNGRFHQFDWKDAKPNVPWPTRLRSLWFVHVELEHFHPAPDIHHLTYLEAIDHVQQALPAWSRTDIENQLMAVAGTRMPELNLDLVAIDPLAAKRELSQQTLSECLFLADQIDEFAQQYGNDQDAAQPAEEADPDEWASQIHKWLDAIPALSILALPQGEPNQPESGAAAKQSALESLLVEIDKRAAEKGAGFDRHSLPGTKKEFTLLLQANCPIFRHVVASTVAAYLKKGKCQFQRGARPEQGKGAAVWALFPEYDFK